MEFTKIIPACVNPVIRMDNDLRISLSGVWQARTDPENIGLAQHWQTEPYCINERVTVPGTVQGAGLGTADEEIHKEFGLSFRPFRSTYEGTAWFRKSFTVPAEFAGKRVWLLFGGAAPTPEIWVNGIRVGDNREPLVPFGFDVTPALREGENNVTVRITEDDRTAMLNYYYDGKWTGLYRDVELYATGEAYIEDFAVLPDAEQGRLTVRCRVRDGMSGGSEKLLLRIFAPDGQTAAEAELPVRDGAADGEIEISSPVLWSPDAPRLYRAEALLTAGAGGEISDRRGARFGFVAFRTDEKHFSINGEPYYFRGCGDFGTFPETLCPNNDREHWRRCLAALRAYGYNAVRCQSHVPVPEYFDAADEVGLLVQSEMGTAGPICGTSNYHPYSQWPKPTPDFREQFRSQWNHIVQRDACHPSAAIYAMGNELGQGGTIKYPEIIWRCYNETKAIHPGALVLWTDGAYAGKFEDIMPDDFINGDAALSNTEDKAVVQHEFRWWSSSPEIRDIARYDGLPARPAAELWAAKAAADHGISRMLGKSGENSRKLQYLEAKCKLENLRRDFPYLAGVSHFNATDIGVSKQGILDEFYERKYATPEMWQQVNGDTVILSSLNFDDRCLTAGETFACTLYVSDFSHPAFPAPVLTWTLTAEGKELAGGELAYDHVPFQTVCAGELSFAVPETDVPFAAELRAVLRDAAGRTVHNAWRLWVFPVPAADPAAEIPAGVRVTRFFDEDTLEYLENGGNVLLTARGEGFVRAFRECLGLNRGRYFFTKPATFFPFEELQDGTIIADHPAFGDFPHEDYADMQFFNLLADSPALDLEPLRLTEDDPLIRMLHCYIVSRPLGTLTERSVGKGRLLICSLDIGSGRTEARYLRKMLLNYLASPEKPACVPLSPESRRELLSASAVSLPVPHVPIR